MAENRMDAAVLMARINKKKAAEILSVSCICGIIFACLCIPITIYTTSSDVNTSITEFGIELDNCSQVCGVFCF